MTSSSSPSIALALSGGGARGIAHIGVLKILEREKISICAIAGTSMGGLIAAFYASGISAAALEEVARTITHPRSLVRLFSIARGQRGLIDSGGIEQFLTEHLGESTLLEQIPIPLTLIAVDLLTGREISLTEGNLVQAILATTAFPGVFTPVEIAGRTLVDGGVLNNLPADAARRKCTELGLAIPCVAVDVSPDFLSTTTSGAEDASSLHWPRFLPGFGRDIYLTEVIMISALTRAHLKSACPEVIIRPSIPPHISILWGFHHPQEAIQAGERAAEEALPQIFEALESCST